MTGLCFDKDNKLWASDISQLVVLNTKLEILKMFDVEQKYRFNSLSKPAKNVNTLILGGDLTTIFWLRSNFNVYQIHSINYRVLRRFTDILTGGIYYILKLQSCGCLYNNGL